MNNIPSYVCQILAVVFLYLSNKRCSKSEYVDKRGGHTTRSSIGNMYVANIQLGTLYLYTDSPATVN